MKAKIDPNYTGQACFLHLKKAFDTLDHGSFFTKLDYYGFRGPINELIAI